MIIDNTDLFDDLDNEIYEKYDEYLDKHISNVQKGYQWIKQHASHLLDEENFIEDILYYGDLDEIIENHDKSKYNKIPNSDRYYELTCEYDAYANYFYSEDKDEFIDKEFDLAWLSHIHNNPHHWQHWMLQNDEDGLKMLDMPYVFLIEMFCDWWAFSWIKNNLYEVFSWYDKRKDGILLSDKSRESLEYIMNEVKAALDNEVK